MKNITLEQMAILLRDGLKLDEQVEIDGSLDYFSQLEANSIFVRKIGYFRLVSYGRGKYCVREGKDFTLTFEVDSKRKVHFNKRENSVNIPTTLNPQASISLCQLGDIKY